MQLNEYSEIKCPQCDEKSVTHKGFHVCSKCGLVIMPEYVASSYVMNDRHSKNEQGKSYVAPGKRNNIVGGLGSYIDHPTLYNLSDIHGRHLSGENSQSFRRLKKQYSFSTRIAKQETEYRVLQILHRITTILELSNDINRQAAYYFRKFISQHKKPAFTTHILLMAACLLIAIREYGVNAPKTIKEISGAFQEFGHRVSTKQLLRETFKVKSGLGLKLKQRKSKDYLVRIISSIIESEETSIRLKIIGWDIEKYQHNLLQTSYKIADSIETKDIGGRNPFIFAVSIIYVADKEVAEKFERRYVLTQKLLSKITGVAAYSIRDHYCKLLKKKK